MIYSATAKDITNSNLDVYDSGVGVGSSKELNEERAGDITRILDSTIIFLIFSQLFVLDYFAASGIPKRVTFALILMHFIYKPRKIQIGSLFSSIILLILLGLNLANGMDIDILIKNGRDYIYSYAYVGFLASYSIDNRTAIKTYFQKLMLYINLYFFLTMAVAWFQLTEHIFIAISNGSYDSSYGEIYWKDAASGLFRFCGTHVLGMYTVFVVLYNLWVYEHETGRRRWIALILAIFETVIALSFGYMNANTALYLMLPIGLLFWFLPSLKLSRIRLSSRTVIIITTIVSITNLLLDSGYLMRFFESNFRNPLHYVLASLVNHGKIINAGERMTGAGERISIFFAAFNLQSTWMFGLGVGMRRRAEPYFLGFKHFGLSDAGSMLVLFGLMLTLVIIYKYMYNYINIANCKAIGKLISALLLIIYFLISLIYTRPISDLAVSSVFALISIIYGLKWDDLSDA